MDLLFNIGPDGSTSAIYISLDAYYMPISQNIVTVNPNETLTLIFYLGLLVSDPNIVWDYANDPYNEISIEVQPQFSASGFELVVDNIWDGTSS